MARQSGGSDDIAAARDFLFSPPPTPAEQIELEFATRARRAHPFERRRPRRGTRGRSSSSRPIDLDRSRTRASLLCCCCCCCRRGRRRRLHSGGFLLLLEALPSSSSGRVRLIRRRQRRHRVRIPLRQRRKQGRPPLGRSRSTTTTTTTATTRRSAATSRWPVEVRRRTFRDGRSTRRRDEAAAFLLGEDMARDRHRCAAAATRCLYTSCDSSWWILWWWRQGRRIGFVVGGDGAVEVPRSEK